MDIAMDDPTVRISVGLPALMRALEGTIEDMAGEPMAFALVIFTPGRASYASNAERERVVRELKHLLACWEAGIPDIPAHHVN